MFFIWMTSREPRINSQPAGVIVISLKGYKKTVGSIFFFASVCDRNIRNLCGNQVYCTGYLVQ